MNPTAVAFAWQDKHVLRLIRENVTDYGSALSVYIALTVVASDKESAEFQTTHKWLAILSGLSTRTVASRLNDLARIGAVVVTSPPGVLQPNNYRLPPLSNGCKTFGNGCRTLGNGCKTFGNGEAPPLQTSEEKKKRTIGEINREPKTPTTVPERIAIDKKIKILQDRLKVLETDSSEQWQRDANPGLVAEKNRLREEITAYENCLLD